MVPREYLIDPWASAHAYILQAIANGADLHRDSEVLSGQFDGDIWTLETPRGSLKAKQVINCAGLYGDIIDQRLTGNSAFTIKPRKGQFVVFDKAASGLLKARNFAGSNQDHQGCGDLSHDLWQPRRWPHG